MSRLLLSLALLPGLLSMNAFSAETCDPDGAVKFVCGTTNPEDLYQVPSTSWVIVSGRYSDSEGPLYAVNIRDHSAREIFPAGALPPQHDRVPLSRLRGSKQRFSTTRTYPAGRQQ